jgi:hypothetical protein
VPIVLSGVPSPILERIPAPALRPFVVGRTQRWSAVERKRARKEAMKTERNPTFAEIEAYRIAIALDRTGAPERAGKAAIVLHRLLVGLRDILQPEPGKHVLEMSAVTVNGETGMPEASFTLAAVPREPKKLVLRLTTKLDKVSIIDADRHTDLASGLLPENYSKIAGMFAEALGVKAYFAERERSRGGRRGAPGPGGTRKKKR